MQREKVLLPSILLFIVNYNSWHDLDVMLSSVDKLTYIPNIVIYDNASKEDKFSLLRNKYPEIGFLSIRSDVNYGYVGALKDYLIKNTLFHDIVLLSNADIIFTDSEVFKNFERIHNDRNIGIVGPKIIDKVSGAQLNPHSTASIGVLFILKKLIMYSSFRIASIINKYHSYGVAIHKPILKESVYSVHGSFFSISKQLIISEGLSFVPWMYGEEEIFAMKCRLANMKVIYDDSSLVIHNSHGATGISYEKWKHRRKKEALSNIIGLKFFSAIRSFFNQ